MDISLFHSFSDFVYKNCIAILINKESRRFLPEYCKNAFLIDDYNWTGALEKLREISKVNKIISAFAFRENSFDKVNEISELFSLNAAFARSLINKAMIYETLLTPRNFEFYTFTNINMAVEHAVLYATNKNKPFIIKPSNYSDSACILRVDPGSDFKFIHNEFHKSIKSASNFGYLSPVNLIVMEYIGDEKSPQEYCVDGFIFDSKVTCIAQEKIGTKSYHPFFDTKIISPPKSLTAHELISTAKSDIEKLNLDNTCFHFEYRTENGNLIPIDCAARPGGGFIPHVFSQHFGVDLRVIHALLSLKIDPTPYTNSVENLHTIMESISGDFTNERKLLIQKLRFTNRLFGCFIIKTSSEIKVDRSFTDQANIGMAYFGEPCS
ncbi:Uncharacterised protein [Chromobacterium vaccinii]|nr:Uncharacterised protein [Chromobacterium vaccinii]